LYVSKYENVVNVKAWTWLQHDSWVPVEST